MARLRNLSAVATAMALGLVWAGLGVDTRAQQPPQPPQPPAAMPLPQCAPILRSGSDNGIGVGDPKVFDNRSLTLMLENLNESLRTVQVVDARSLAAALNMLQGFQQDTVTRSISLQGAPLPGITETAKSTLQLGTTGNVADTSSGTGSSTSVTSPDPKGGTSTVTTTTGATSGSTSAASVGSTTSAGQENSRQTTTAARTPVNPDLPALLTSPSYTPQFGQNGADLLNDQVNLTYQIFNVRMLLERSLTDRLIGDAPRLQAVLGFNVSVNPPRDAQDSAAFVEVSVEAAGHTDPVSVVAMMPQEKTYNSAALSSKSTAFGGSAVAQVFSVGYNQRNQSQLFYLFRDNDTVSFEPTRAGAKHFGWAFRPVLGRRAVASTPRQMFAVISLPRIDGDNALVPLNVTVRTYWRHYDRDTLTTADGRSFWQAVGRGLSLWSTQDRPPADEASYTGCVFVPTTPMIQTALTPRIEELDWRSTDEKTAVVSVRGRNFFQGTSVRLGSSRIATPAEGLVLKNDMGFDLTVPLSTLLGAGVVDGRYGNAIDMHRPGVPSTGMEIDQVTIDPPGGGRRAYYINLSGPQGSPLSMEGLPGRPLISLGGVLMPPPYRIYQNHDRVTLQVYPSVEQFPNAEGLLTVSFPFAGERWSQAKAIYDPARAFTVTRFAQQETGQGQTAVKTTKLLVTTTDTFANPFAAPCPANSARPAWAVTLGTAYDVGRAFPVPPRAASAVSDEMLEMRLPTEDLDKHPLLLTNCDDVVFRLAVPSATAKVEDPELKTVTPATVKLHDARKVVIEGANLGRIAAITANGYRLDTRATNSGKSLEVFLIGALTEHPGVLTLVGRDDKGTILGSIDITITSSGQ